MNDYSRVPRWASTLVLLLVLGLSAGAQTGGLREVDVSPSNLDWISVAGSETAFATGMAGSVPFYAVSIDGGRTIATARRARYEVLLRYARFDPLLGEPAVATALRAPAGSRLHLVQYATQGLEIYRRVLQAHGAEILHFLPRYGNVVRMDAATRATVKDLPFVRWIGDYHVAYRIDEVMRDELSRGTMPRRRYNIQVTREGLSEKLAVAEFASSLGAEVDDYISPHGFLLTAELDAQQLLAVARRDDVLFVDRWSPEEPDMDVARQLGGADYLETVEGYTGAGVRGQVRDSGLLFAHPDFQRNPPIPHAGTAGSTSHGTSVFGIVFGTGATSSTARGMLPDGQGIFHSAGTTVDRFIETGELLQDPYRCVFETNSTGDARTFFYTTISADMDNILFNHDVVVLQSQSNAGNQDSRPQAWAKNIISVGGIRHMDTLATSDDTWNFGGSIGPAADGRIKPDISAFYDNIRTTSDSGGHTNTFGGTSGATPITAGHVGLLHQMWADGIFGNRLSSWDVFDNKPTATLAKALLLNSTAQYPFSGTGHDLTRVHQGWGRPNLQNLYDRRGRLMFVDETDLLTNLQSTFYPVNVTAADPEFRATLVYRDRPGNPAAAMHRINDITIIVTDPVGTTYFGNNGLLASNFSTPGGLANDLDTVEQVIVDNPMPGPWLVEVLAADIVQDTHVETGALDADYALVVSGVDPPPGPAPDIGQANQPDASFRVIDSLNLNGQKPKVGVNGPFFVTRATGDALELQFEGPPGRTFILLFGTLNRNNASFPGIGQLDLGLNGNVGDYGDVMILMNGVTGTSFVDLIARVDATGRQSLSFTLPASVPPGVVGSMQALFFDAPTADLGLTAATQITKQ